MSEAEAASLPIDAKTISATVDLVLGMSLGTSKREDIDVRVGQLTGFLNLLKGQCLGEDEDQDVLRLLGMVDRHLALSNRPTRRSQAHEAFNYMHDAAVFASALLSAYTKKNGIVAS
ncbi:hypothetical protein GCM10010339_57600 [Streptomyces alanosinicus]|uniref:Uncharacterized protein n=2 Tax=Streptomyces alanosinicus TaxID=68171 RepID=A0A919D5B0_9ACTN|nr:hypothetical protein GCM10010339_57600 [Streptomyces alanosinicus]